MLFLKVLRDGVRGRSTREFADKISINVSLETVADLEIYFRLDRSWHISPIRL